MELLRSSIFRHFFEKNWKEFQWICRNTEQLLFSVLGSNAKQARECEEICAPSPSELSKDMSSTSNAPKEPKSPDY